MIGASGTVAGLTDYRASREARGLDDVSTRDNLAILYMVLRIHEGQVSGRKASCLASDLDPSGV